MKNLFEDIKGQDKATEILIKHLQGGRISHAYLFLGLPGMGKEFLAKEFARYILCEAHKEDDCVGCVRFKKGSHPDLIFVEGSEGIKIEAVKEAIERISLSPNLSKYKVVIFSGSENLGHEAANALLKTLEEPPADTVILLTAVSESSLPQTIVSRAQKIKLRSLEKGEIEQILKSDFSLPEIEKALAYVNQNLDETKRFIRDPDFKAKREEMVADVETLLQSASIIEKFKVIEKYEKKKTLKEFFDLFAREFFLQIANKIVSGEDVAGDAELGTKILKIYSNLEYNVNLRASFEEIIIGNS